MSVPSSCPPPPELQQYLLGQLPVAETQRLKQHIDSCPACQRAVQTFWPEDTLAGSLPAAAAVARAETAAGNLHNQATMLPAPAPLTGIARGEYDFLAPAEAPDEIGRLGGYRVLKVLGVGGMGVVFLAEDPGLKRQVALKTMKPAVAISDVNRQRFIREARAAAAIEHDHIVSIYQVGEAQGVPFLAMQLLRGESLDDRLKRDGRLPLVDLLRFGREMAEGLSAAHQAGIVHRDMKPSNVWLEDLPDGRTRVKLVDFGLARGGSDDPHLTEAGFVVGTPAYMSPEQAQGQPVDARGDLFSLGGVLYHAGTGIQPFRGPDVLSTLMAVASASPKRPRELNPELPTSLENLILKLLAKYPHERPATARAVAEELGEIENELTLPDVELVKHEMPVAREPAATSSPPNVRPSPRPPRSFRLWPLAAAALLLVGVVGTAGYLMRPDLFSETAATPTTRNDQAVVVDPTLPASQPVTTSDPRPRTGTLSIDGPRVEIIIKQQGKTIRERTAGRRFELPPGEYDVELAEYVPNTEVSPALAKVKPGQDTVVKIKARRAMIVPERGKPLSSFALVNEPAPLDRVHAWTVETREHRGPVRTLAYSPNGKSLATAGDDGTVRLWDAAGVKLERILVGHEAGIASLAWSPDSVHLVTRGHDKSVRFWEVATGTPIRVRSSGNYQAIAWSADGKRIALNGSDNSIHLWQFPGAVTQPELKGHTDRVRAVAYSPDGKWLASCGADKTVRLWPLGDGGPPVVLNGHTDTVTVLAWSADSKLLASGSKDQIRIWDAERGELLRKLPWEPSTKVKAAGVSHAQSLAWLPTGTGRKLASINSAGVTVWSADSDKPQHTNSLPGHAVTWSADGKTLAVALLDDPTVRLLDAVTLKPLSSLPGFQTSRSVLAAWSFDGKRLASVDEDRVIRIWDGPTGRFLYGLALQTPTNVSAVTWSPDGKRLAAVTTWDGKIHLWDADTGKVLPAWTTSAASLHGVAWAPNGKTLVAAGDKSGRPFFLEADTGKLKELKTPPAGHDGPITALAWNPESIGLVSSGTDGRVLHWGPEGRRPPASVTIQAYKQSIGAIAWDRDGKRLATAGTTPDTPVKIWDREGKVVKEFKDHQVKIVGLVFSPDGNSLLGRGDDGVLRSWDIASGKLTTLTRPVGVELLPERGLRATTADGASLRLWDFAGAKPLATLVSLSQGASEAWLVLTPEGRYHSSAGVKDSIVCVVQTDQGQEVLRPEEFRARFKWKDEPEKVQLPSGGR